ncbi:MAG TPA: putative porin [Gammaproteobacteria bacterium]|nr:putative porin [Gammaproteobacteria bacterium]
MPNSLVAAVVAASFALCTGAAAQPAASAEIAAIRAEMAGLMARLERLERGNAAAATSAAAAATPAAAAPADARVAATVPPNIRFAGDMRYRHEAINEDGVAERERQRIRARFGVTADIAKNVRVGLQLASGTDDPVSANQTLDTGFNRKQFGIDRAFFTWAATEQLTFTGGKFANPFFRPGNHHLIYDNDLNPEGLALRYARGDWFANYAGLWVEERSAADDSIMLGGQFGFRHMLDNGMRVTAGASYYDYLETQGRTPFWDAAAAGNRLAPGNVYLNDFNMTELFGELNLKAGERPVTVFADYVVNSEAADADTGFALGASLGEVTRAGTWRIGYAYQDLEADAVIGTFTDSDFAGGGTDGKGHVVEFNYGFRDRLVFGLRYFLNERGADAGTEHDYNRLQADVVFNY